MGEPNLKNYQQLSSRDGRESERREEFYKNPRHYDSNGEDNEPKLPWHAEECDGRELSV